MRYGSGHLRFLVLTVLGGACGDAANSADSMSAEDTTQRAETQSGNARAGAAAGRAAAGSGTAPEGRAEPSTDASAAGRGGAVGTAPSMSAGAAEMPALLASVDLSMHSQGLLVVAATPDAETAGVPISAGWLEVGETESTIVPWAITETGPVDIKYI